MKMIARDINTGNHIAVRYALTVNIKGRVTTIMILGHFSVESTDDQRVIFSYSRISESCLPLKLRRKENYPLINDDKIYTKYNKLCIVM